LIIVENCRVKMTMSRILMLPEIFLGFAFSSTLTTVIRCRPKLRHHVLCVRGFDRGGFQLAGGVTRGVGERLAYVGM
jgi:hypothetical protein